MPHLHLYHMPVACSRITHIALEMTRQPYEVTVVRIHKGDLKTSAYLRLNPAGQVPCLLVDGHPVVENPVILGFLARLFPEAGILPVGDPLTEAAALSRLSFCSSSLHPIVTRIMFPERFCDEPESAAARTRELAVAMMLGKLATLEPVLAKQPWLLGETFSIADAYLWWVTGRMRGVGLDFSGLPALSAHIDRVHAHPVVKGVMAREVQNVADVKADGMVYTPTYESILFA